MNLPIISLLSAAAAYLIGAIPFGYLVGLAKGINIRKIGSGNIGAANVGRNLGFKWGVFVFLLDVAKGFLPVLLAGRLVERHVGQPSTANTEVCLAWLFVALFPVMGHNFSLFLGFRGGKGVATSLGVALALYPHLTVPAAVSFAVWATVALTLRISSLGSMLAAVAFPLAYLATSLIVGWDRSPRWPFVLFTTLASLMVLVLHRANIARLLAGTESRLGEISGQDGKIRQ